MECVELYETDPLGSGHTEPSTADEKDKMIKLYQNLVTPIAIELHCLDWYWDHLEYNGWSILVVHIPFPESFALSL